MNIFTAFCYLQIVHYPKLVLPKDSALLLNWLDIDPRYGHKHPLTYELSRALHDFCFCNSRLGTYKLDSLLVSSRIIALTESEQKELASWIYDLNFSRSRRS